MPPEPPSGSATDFAGEEVARERLHQLLPDVQFTAETTSQHQLQLLLDSRPWSASIRDRARINALTAQHVGAWLRAIPIRNLGLVMPSREFRFALRFRLGISMFPSPSDAKRSACGAIIDGSGDHLLGCNQAENLRTKRHNALCDVLFNALLVDDSRCRREMRCDSTSVARPGDIFHLDFERGLPTYFDLTVRNSLQPAYLIKAATCAGAAAEAGELEKDQRHDSLVSSAGSIFYPIVVESL